MGSPDPSVRGGAAPSLVAVIPALDAAATIEAVVAGALRHVRRVIVVDDGSTDDTAERARRAGAEVLRHPANRGKGAALATAFETLLTEARAGAGSFAGAISLDADGQHDPDDIPAFVDLYLRQRPALIVGSRDRDFARMWGPRRAMNRFSSASLRFFAGVDLPDSQSGFRLYDAGFLKRLRLEGRRYEAEMEALMRAAEWRLPIASLPIRLRVVDGRATSHYRPLGDTFRIIGAVLRHWLRRLAARPVRSRS
ncbi:MAG TPA: glycosyltransferase family 2 protein [Candidatus Polarisedimenticolia bacterium]|nr:glycosyltransferase family 2 protein [Candidatus Polarisedimenticolia bacterium]